MLRTQCLTNTNCFCFIPATVFLLLVAGNLENLLESLSGGHKKFHTCIWLVIVVAALTPLTWLGTPKDFWQAGIIAATTTSIGGIIVVISLAVVNLTCNQKRV